MLILLYNTQWDRPVEETLSGCPAHCSITLDRARLQEADAVLFHVPTLGDTSRLRKLPHQMWVAWSMESHVYYPMLADPEFLRPFDLTMTYRLSSDVPVPYLESWMVDDLRRPPQPKTADALAANFISNREDRCGRFEYVRELMRHIPVHSYGRTLRNRRLAADTGRETKLETIARYPFTLAFENSQTEDYVTEKFFDPLIVGSVPVYLGAPNVDAFAPGAKCFINAADFTPRQLAEFLMSLVADSKEYESYLAWKHSPFRGSFDELHSIVRTSAFCRLCLKLHEVRETRGGPIWLRSQGG